MSSAPRLARLAGLAAIVPLCALAGGWLDELDHLGFTAWSSACRAGGFSFASLLVFTFELLPRAVIGALSGGLAMQLLAFAQRHRACHADEILATHAGCMLTMPAGLILCALAWPIPLMLVAEMVLAMSGAWLLLRRFGKTAPGKLVALNP
jgi:hypothetical protein